MSDEGKGYDKIIQSFDRDRNKSLREKHYLELLIDGIPANAHILDVGCGSAEPIAKYLIDKGYKVTGVDASQEMIHLSKQRYPGMEWLYGDMRDIKLADIYDALIAYDSFFHLKPDDQVRMIARFSQWLKPGGKMLISTGQAEGEVVDALMYGVPFSYYSLSIEKYLKLFKVNNFDILLTEEDQPSHRVWIAKKMA